MKIYQVIFVDEYNNFYELGLFRSLLDAEPEVNNMLDSYQDIDSGETPRFGEDENLGHLEEYPSTFSMCFDRTIDIEEGCVQIRGFIKDSNDMLEDIKKLLEKK